MKCQRPESYEVLTFSVVAIITPRSEESSILVLQNDTGETVPVAVVTREELLPY
jgi:hypothetical protein